MNSRASYLVPMAVLMLGVVSCAGVVDPDKDPSSASVGSAVLGDDCVTDAQCDATEICCGGACLSRTSDNNCGACGIVCPGATTCLENATCGCPEPTTRCGNSCFDTSINKNNCGACGNRCLGATTCLGGACGCEDPALTACGNSCVDVLTSNAHCGACDTPCPGATTCMGGACGCANPAHTQCGDACVNTVSDSANCGACGNACGAGEICSSGVCSRPMNWAASGTLLDGRAHHAATTFPLGAFYIGGDIISGGMPALAGDSYFFTTATGWRKVNSPTVPNNAGRKLTSVVYDEANARFVVFSGLGAAGTLPGETWALTDATTAAAAWTRIVDESPDGPDKRYGHRMVYIPTRQSILMVAGATGAYGRPDPLVADTWEFMANTWTPICGAGAAPACPFSRRYLEGLAYDSLRDRVVMFGGQVENAGLLSAETWEYDPNIQAWTDQTPILVAQSPSPRNYVNLAYHLGRGRVIMHGGIEYPSIYKNDTWEWRGDGWVQLPGTSPPLRYGPALAYSPAHLGLLVLGGATPGGAFTPLPDVSLGQ